MHFLSYVFRTGPTNINSEIGILWDIFFYEAHLPLSLLHVYTQQNIAFLIGQRRMHK